MLEKAFSWDFLLLEALAATVLDQVLPPMMLADCQWNDCSTVGLQWDVYCHANWCACSRKSTHLIDHGWNSNSLVGCSQTFVNTQTCLDNGRVPIHRQHTHTQLTDTHSPAKSLQKTLTPKSPKSALRLFTLINPWAGFNYTRIQTQSTSCSLFVS